MTHSESIATNYGAEMQSTCLPDSEYDTTITAVVRIPAFLRSLKIERSPWTGRYAPDDVKAALGEQFDVWPARIIPALDPEDRP